MLQNSSSAQPFGQDKALVQNLKTDESSNEPANKVWLAVIAGLLIATSNTWLFHPQLKHSTYSAPWIHPGYEPEQSHSI